MEDSLHQRLLSENYYKLFLSKEFGGRGDSLPEAVQIIHSLSKKDGDLGWMVAIGSGGNYFCGYLNETVSHNIFKPKEALIAGSGATTGVAKKMDGGWLVSGEWKYCSGCHNATTFTFNCLTENSDEKISVAIAPEHVNIHEDWDAIGLKSTDTHTVSVQNAFVPFDHVFDTLEQKTISHSAQSYPFLDFAVMCFIPVVDGLSQQIIARSKEICISRDWDVELVEKIEQERESRWRKILEMCNRSWNLHLANQKDEELNRVLVQHCIAHNKTCRLEMTKLFGSLGMAVLYNDHPLNKAYRHLLTASQHSLLREV